MKKEVVFAFSRAIEAVLAESGVKNMHIGTPAERPRGSKPQSFEVSISIGVAGALRGFMFLQADFASAAELAREISLSLGVPLEDPEVFGTMHKAALAELANQVSGRATMYLADMGLDTNITPPTILTGSGIMMGVSDQVQFHDARLSGPTSELNLVVGLQAS